MENESYRIGGTVTVTVTTDGAELANPEVLGERLCQVAHLVQQDNIAEHAPDLLTEDAMRSCVHAWNAIRDSEIEASCTLGDFDAE